MATSTISPDAGSHWVGLQLLSERRPGPIVFGDGSSLYGDRGLLGVFAYWCLMRPLTAGCVCFGRGNLVTSSLLVACFMAVSQVAP